MPTEFLSRQHRRIENILQALHSDGHRRNRLLLELTGELTTHLAVESNLVYPAAAHALGRSLPAQNALHRRLKAGLLGLTQAGVTGEEFAVRLSNLTRLFEQHVACETALFPVLIAAIAPATMDDLNDDIEAFASALMAKCRPYVRTQSNGFAA